MTSYQLHFLKRGLITRTYDFEADNDADAVVFAAVWVEGAPMELCCGDRLLKRWSAEVGNPFETTRDEL